MGLEKRLRTAVELDSRSAAFRRVLTSPKLDFLMEAHNGLSAKIVEEAGFAGIWASGLSISAALGVRDNNEASWTQVLEVLEFMADATALPIMVDGDTGYGNFNNVRRLVKKLCQRNVAAVCIEDKLFPKTNSFIGENQPLADVDEFCGRIKAGKDSQADDNFSLVARIEALISGWGMEEALRRAEAYHRAGADAILIHSKKSKPDEIVSFCREWANRAPVVIVPTMYSATPTDVFRKAGVSVAIWANHNLRASLKAMRDVSRRIMDEQSVVGVEESISSVNDVFDITGNRELAEAERRYLPARTPTRAVVLAASRGAALGELTASIPKCMLEIQGRPLLQILVSTLKEGGADDITVVRGYRKETINLSGISTADNDAYETTGELSSLLCAEKALVGPCLLAYGDILFRRYVLNNLLDAQGDIVVVVDARAAEKAPSRSTDLVSCSAPYTGEFIENEPARVTSFKPGAKAVSGEWIGLAKLSARGAELAREELMRMAEEGLTASSEVPHLLQRLIERGHTINVSYIVGHWLDVNDAFDLAQARKFL
jgi:phosphoenolpyruvate phosphomutase